MTSRGTSPVAAASERQWIVVGVALLVVIYVLIGLFTAVADDEPLFADPARSAALGRGFAAPVLGGQLVGAEQRLMWQPPGYLAVLAVVFRFFGFGLTQGRTISAIAAAAAVALVYVLSRRYASPRYAALGAGFAAVLPWTVRAATTIRPDACTAALFLAAVVALISWVGNGSRSHLLVVAALCSAGAMLTHPIGAMAPLTVGLVLSAHRKWRALAGLVAVVIVVVAALWAIYIGSLWPEFLAQMAAQAARKTSRAPVLETLLHGNARPVGYVVVLVALTTAWWVGRRRRLVPSIVGVAAAVAAAAGLVGGENQYPLFTVLVGAPILAVVVERVLTARPRLSVVALPAFIVVAASPAALMLTYDRGASSRDATIAALVADRPVYLGYGAAGVYFRSPTMVRVVNPVPAPPAAIDVVRGSRTVLIEPITGRHPGPGWAWAANAGDLAVYDRR